MNRDKQIEEMARIPESEMGMSGYSKFSWKLWEAGLCTMAEAEKADQIMRNMGYRKADEVAREIFEEIDRMLEEEYVHIEKCKEKARDDDVFCELDGELCGLDMAQSLIAELKKKYITKTEGEG